jgi:hypothetical protein
MDSCTAKINFNGKAKVLPAYFVNFALLYKNAFSRTSDPD